MDKTSLHQALEKLSENSRTLTVFKIIQRQIIIYIFYFTEVQVSRVIIVLLLRNCFVWCKDHTHQAILTTELLELEVIADAPQSIESSALRNTFYSKNEFIFYFYFYIILFSTLLAFLALDED